MANATDGTGLRVLNDAELDLVAGGDPGNGNGATHTDVVFTGSNFTEEIKTVTTPSGNQNLVFSETIQVIGGGTITDHATQHTKP